MWLKEVFNTEKPVIGMVHLHAMPTDPRYEKDKGIEYIIECAKKDIIALQEGGVDGLLFCNEYAIPYTANIKGITIATYARVVGELRSVMTLPFGITCPSNPYATYDIAVVMTNDFIEENVILKQHKIVIIHGIGKGIVKNAMTKVLKENKNVIDYKVDIFNPGCTIVELRVL